MIRLFANFRSILFLFTFCFGNWTWAQQVAKPANTKARPKVTQSKRLPKTKNLKQKQVPTRIQNLSTPQTPTTNDIDSTKMESQDHGQTPNDPTQMGSLPDISLFKPVPRRSRFLRSNFRFQGGLNIPAQADANPRLSYGGGFGFPVSESMSLGLGAGVAKESRNSTAEVFQLDTLTLKADYTYWPSNPVIEGGSAGVYLGYSHIRYRLENAVTRTVSGNVDTTNNPLFFGFKLGFDWSLVSNLSLGVETSYSYFLKSNNLNAFQMVDLLIHTRVIF